MSKSVTILKDFSGSCSIFPLPDFVLFPRTGQSFHIFEERYIDMVKSVLAGERFVTLTLLKSGWEDSRGDPRIHSVGTLGYIFESKTLPNGDYDIMVMGLKKVSIHEATRDYTYRRGAMTFLDEIEHWANEEEDRQRLIHIFARFLEISDAPTRLSLIDNPLIDSQTLTNMICALLPIPVSEQQKLLELPDVSLRLDIVYQYLEKQIETKNRIDELKDILPLPPDWN